MSKFLTGKNALTVKHLRKQHSMTDRASPFSLCRASLFIETALKFLKSVFPSITMSNDMPFLRPNSSL